MKVKRKYIVTIEEILTRNIIIEAEDETDAEHEVVQLYYKEKIVLDENDL